MILEESPGTGYIYVIVLVTFIYCCVLYILHVSEKNNPRLGGFISISCFCTIYIFISREYVSLTLLC